MGAPTELTELLPPDQEFSHLVKYLGLPSTPRYLSNFPQQFSDNLTLLLRLLLDSPFSLVLARRWMSHPELR